MPWSMTSESSWWCWCSAVHLFECHYCISKWFIFLILEMHQQTANKKWFRNTVSNLTFKKNLPFQLNIYYFIDSFSRCSTNYHTAMNNLFFLSLLFLDVNKELFSLRIALWQMDVHYHQCNAKKRRKKDCCVYADIFHHFLLLLLSPNMFNIIMGKEHSASLSLCHCPWCWNIQTHCVFLYSAETFSCMNCPSLYPPLHNT